MDNAILKELFEEDQRDRDDGMKWFNNKMVARLIKRDAARIVAF